MPSNIFSEDHGGLNPSELKRLGIAADRVIDFSVNSNPFGPPEAVREAIRSVDISAYPDRECGQLRNALAALNGVSPANVLIGSGTAELIWLAARAFLRPGDPVVIVGPTFGEYRRAANASGAEVIEVRAEPPAFPPPLDRIIEVVRAKRPRLVFVCNPNNPTGKYLRPGRMEQFLKAIPSGSLVVLDEAYRAFIDGSFFGACPTERCILLRSMTKDFALAGLRLGYALAAPDIIQRLKGQQPVWSVNALAQSAGYAALSELDYYRGTLAKLREMKGKLFRDLQAIDCMLIGSDTHFFMLRAPLPAHDFRLQLLRSGIQVRDCTSFSLSEFIRVSTRLPSENRELVRVLKRLERAGTKEGFE